MNPALFYVLKWEREIERNHESRTFARGNRRKLDALEVQDGRVKQMASACKPKAKTSPAVRDRCQPRDARCQPNDARPSH